MIVGIAGEGGSGKGTVADALLARGFKRGKFANALKEMLRTLLKYRGLDAENIERFVEGDLKELPTPWLNGKSPRHAMQTLGTEWGRDLIDANLWVDIEIGATAHIEHLLFDDVRHDNEEAAIVAAGGVVLQLVGRKSGVGAHSSENFVPKNPFVIENDGSIEELHAKVNQFVSDFSWADVA